MYHSGLRDFFFLTQTIKVTHTHTDFLLRTSSSYWPLDKELFNYGSKDQSSMKRLPKTKSVRCLFELSNSSITIIKIYVRLKKNFCTRLIILLCLRKGCPNYYSLST